MAPNPTADIFRDILHERARQEHLQAKGRFKYTCADPRMAVGDKALALGEEFGEVCQAVLEEADLSYDKHPTMSVRKELVQIAAVAVAWVESIDHAANHPWHELVADRVSPESHD